MGTDWITMLRNLAHSLVKVEDLLFWIFYILGLFLVISGVLGLMHFGMHDYGDSEEKTESLMKIVAGIFFLALPYTLRVFFQTFFGTDSSLAFEAYGGYNLYDAMKILIQVAGIIWFGLGVMMFIRKDHGGQSKSFKSIAYMVGGICALNFEYLIKALNYIINALFGVFK